MVECFLEMIIGIFGILKVGGVYLLIDFDFFVEWIYYIVRDLGINILFIYGELFENFNFFGICINMKEE